MKWVLVCAVGFALNLWIAISNVAGSGIDFNQFYSASQLAGTGHLYDWDTLRKIEEPRGVPMPTGRLPVVAWGLKILSFFPYRAARILWLCGSLGALIVFCLIWPGANRVMMLVALSWSVPAALLLIFGQDTPFWLLFFAAGWWLMERDRPALAGVAFALCICKFHLTLGLLILLLAQKRWRVLLGGGVAVAFLLAACFLIEGPAWPRQYLDMMHLPMFSPAPERMPNLHGLAAWLPAPVWFEAAGAGLLAVLLWLCGRRTADLGMAGAAAAAGGLLLGVHGYANDTALLIPLAVLTIQRREPPRWLKVWGVFLLTPATTLMLSSAKPLWGQALIVAFAFAALGAAQWPAPHRLE